MREVSPCQERFFFSTTVTATGGFGIGLSIALSIAEGHRGSIKAKSDDGRTIEFAAELRQMTK